MNRRRLATAGAVALTVALLARRSNRRARRHPAWVIPFAAIFGASRSAEIDFGYPGTVLDNIGSFFGGLITTVVGDITGAVSAALNWVLNIVQTWLVKLYTALTHIIGAIPGAFGSVVDYVRWLEDTFDTFVGSIYDSIRNGIVDGITAGLDAGGWLAGLLTDWLGSVLQGVIAAGGWFYGFVANIVTDILQSALQVGSWIYDLIAGIVGYVVDQLFADVGWLWGRLETFVNQLLYDGLAVGEWLYNWIKDEIVQPLIDLALQGLGDLLAVVQGAWDFLVWVAQHPLQWFIDQFEDLAGLRGDALWSRIGEALDSESGHAFSILDDLFG